MAFLCGISKDSGEGRGSGRVNLKNCIIKPL